MPCRSRSPRLEPWGVVTDLGIAYTQQGNVQKACKLARQALNITTNTQSKAVLERVRTLCGALEPWKETEEVKDLEKQLDTMLTLITAVATSLANQQQY